MDLYGSRQQTHRTLTSSGTNSSRVSKVRLDAETSKLQLQALCTILSDLVGSRPLPLLVLDAPFVLSHSSEAGAGNFSGRVAGVQGFSLLGKQRTFALDERLEPDIEALEKFAQTAKQGPVLLYGFTFVIYQHFLKGLRAQGRTLDLSNGILVHGGGWKHLRDRNVTDELLRRDLVELCNLTRVHDYYGMAEQMGSIFLQCEERHFHCSAFSEIIARRAGDFSPCKVGESGILQTLSILPRSYPGHSLLTEDEGVLLGEDNCPCGRFGKYFHISGRLKKAELRGCGDVYASEISGQ